MTQYKWMLCPLCSKPGASEFCGNVFVVLFFCQHGPKIFPYVKCLLSSLILFHGCRQELVPPRSPSHSIFGSCSSELGAFTEIRLRSRLMLQSLICRYAFLFFLKQSDPGVFHTSLPIPSDMIIRLGRLTPGYFRLLQRQVAGEVQTQPQDRAVNQIAMMLAILGLGLSYYSAKQMTEKVQVQPAP
ncbi:hypothetical protein fugu_009674 [Takifugu bimaculatus]|uniref:Uncharacterized protein n=1 Tax=Takifugu bimaculatus TaxID=433685 RepID=A0A4Z2CD90_9TELE|nr:hypothetical protein fugu_009674 [Takifugu bimaculatus]